jgi:hypothetical protein
LGGNGIEQSFRFLAGGLAPGFVTAALSGPPVNVIGTDLTVAEARQLRLHVICEVVRITIEPGQDVFSVEGSVASTRRPHSPEQGAPRVVVVELRVVDVDCFDGPGE